MNFSKKSIYFILSCRPVLALGEQNFLSNGGFESMGAPPSTNPPNYTQTKTVEAWQTTATDGLIEIWASGYSSSSQGPVHAITQADPFFSNGGQFFAELNATQVSTLYQEVTATKSGFISYSFWGRGRNATDVMALRIDQNIGGKWVPIYLKEFSNAPGVWVNHRGEEIGLVKKGEQLRFNYVSIKGSTQSIGNFLDNAAFGVLDFTEPGLPELPGNPDTGGQVPGQPEQPYNPIINGLVEEGLAFEGAVADQTFQQFIGSGGMLSGQFYTLRTRRQVLPEDPEPYVAVEDSKAVVDPKAVRDPNTSVTNRYAGTAASTGFKYRVVEKPLNRWNLWSTASGIYSQFGALDKASSRDSFAGTFMFGADYALRRDLSIGLFASYQILGQKFQQLGGGSILTNGLSYGGYISYARPEGGFYGDLAAGGGGYQSSITRPINYQGVNYTSATANTNSTGFFCLLDGGYDWKLGRWTLGPVASLQYSYLFTPAYSESDPFQLNVHVNSQQMNSLYSGLGAHLSYTIPISRNIVIVPELRCVWNHDFLNEPRTLTGSTAFTPGATYSYTDPQSFQNAVSPSAGFTAVLGKNLTASIFNNGSTQTVNLSGTFSF